MKFNLDPDVPAHASTAFPIGAYLFEKVKPSVNEKSGVRAHMCVRACANVCDQVSVLGWLNGSRAFMPTPMTPIVTCRTSRMHCMFSYCFDVCSEISPGGHHQKSPTLHQQ